MERSNTFAAMRRAALIAAPLTLAMTLAACDGDGGGMAPPVSVVTPAPTPAPTPTPTPTPTPSPTSRNVTACLNQVIPVPNSPIANLTPASLVVPDTIKMDLTKASGFPNGRRLEDPVVDIVLAALFLRLDGTNPEPVSRFAALPLNPAANDINGGAFMAAFPFVLPPQGTPPLATGTGSAFNFRTDPFTSYVRVDREGQPAVATAVIGAAMKNAYNDAGPAEDAAGTFVPEIVSQLTTLHNALADDLINLGFRVCST